MTYESVFSTDDFLYPPPAPEAGPASWGTYAAKLLVKATEEDNLDETVVELVKAVGALAAAGYTSASVGIACVLMQLREVSDDND